jgi:putative tricarboxylic transport membrane protein
MKMQRTVDMVTGSVLTLLALLVLVGAYQIEVEASSRLQTRTFPVLLGVLLLAAGGALTYISLRSKEEVAVEWPERDGFKRIGVVIGATVLYLLLIETVGFPLMSLFYVGYLIWYFGRYKWYVCAFAGTITALVLRVLFMEFLQLSLPPGILG